MGVIGVDPGQSGALVFLGDVKNSSLVMPVVSIGKRKAICARTLKRWLTSLKPDKVKLVILESVHSMPKQGVSSTFAFGTMYGEIRGMLAMAGFKVVEVTPQSWKRVLLENTEKDKQAAIDFATTNYPLISLLATERSYTPHTGIADAICLAEYGKRLLNTRK